MAPSSERLLLASIHDVSPRFESEVDQLTELLEPYVGQRIAMLVVPNHWGDCPITPHSHFAARLRGWADRGFEIFLHGYFHRDMARHTNAFDQVRARLMTAREGEFLGLSRAESAARIAEGRSLLEDVIGRPVDGFVAPAWLYGPETLTALSEAAMPLAEDHFSVWSPRTGQRLAWGPVITWASRTKPRLASSLVAAAVLRRAPLDVLRVATHPPDCGHPVLVKSIARTFGYAGRRRRAARYAELLAR